MRSVILVLASVSLISCSEPRIYDQLICPNFDNSVQLVMTEANGLVDSHDVIYNFFLQKGPVEKPQRVQVASFIEASSAAFVWEAQDQIRIKLPENASSIATIGILPIWDATYRFEYQRFSASKDLIRKCKVKYSAE